MTLAEIMVVLFLVFVLATTLLPKLNLQGARVRAGVDEARTVLLQAQRAAVVRQHDVVVHFDASAASLIVHGDADNDRAIGASEDVRIHDLSEHVAFGARDVPELSWGPEPVGFPDAEVIFHRDGSASAEGGVYLSSVRQMATGTHPEETRALLVTRSTGSVECRRVLGEGWQEACR